MSLTGFTLGEKTSTQLGIYLRRRNTQHPILPQTRDRTIEIPGRHGAYDFGADMGPRPISLDCAVINKNDPAALQAAARSLSAHLIDAQGKPKTMKLIFYDEPGKHYYVRYSGRLPIDRIVVHGFFTLPLLAFDPHAYGEEKQEEEIVQASPHSIMVETKGNVESPPIIILENIGTTTVEGFTLKHVYVKEGE